MQRKSNRTILRKLRNITRVFLYKNHDLEKFGKHRHRVVNKKFDDKYAVVLMLHHMQNLLKASLTHIEDKNLTAVVNEYLTKLKKFTSAIEANCSLPRSPVQRGLVRRILTAHKNFYKRLLDFNLQPNIVQPIDLEELTKMIQAAVYVWKDEFKDAVRLTNI